VFDHANQTTADRLNTELYLAEAKAWDALSRYKFMMFGYWAGVWVHLNRVGGFKQPNPWKAVVKMSRKRERREG
jgi:hypothetical protein